LKTLRYVEKIAILQTFNILKILTNLSFGLEKRIQDVKTILKNSRWITIVVENIDLESILDKSKKEDLSDINHIIIYQENIFLGSCSYFKNRHEKINLWIIGLTKAAWSAVMLSDS